MVQLVHPLTSSTPFVATTPPTTPPTTTQPSEAQPSEIETETFAKQVARTLHLWSGEFLLTCTPFGKARICSVLKKWVEAHYDELPRGVIDLLLAFVRGRLLRQKHPAYSPMVLLPSLSPFVPCHPLSSSRTLGSLSGNVHHKESTPYARRRVVSGQHLPSASA